MQVCMYEHDVFTCVCVYVYSQACIHLVCLFLSVWLFVIVLVACWCMSFSSTVTHAVSVCFPFLLSCSWYIYLVCNKQCAGEEEGEGAPQATARGTEAAAGGGSGASQGFTLPTHSFPLFLCLPHFSKCVCDTAEEAGIFAFVQRLFTPSDAPESG